MIAPRLEPTRLVVFLLLIAILPVVSRTATAQPVSFDASASFSSSAHRVLIVPPDAGPAPAPSPLAFAGPSVSSLPLASRRPPDGPSPFVRGLRGAAIGTVVGGGLGLFIGRVPLEAFEGSRDCSRERCTFDNAEDDDASIHMVIPGVWLGSLIGALAGTSSDTDGETLLLTGGGAVIAGLFGALGGAAVSGSSRWGTLAGYGVGASLGAAAGVAARSRNASGLVRLRDGRLHLGVPDVARVPDAAGSGSATRVRLFHARF